jgi:predicted metal-dependent RNase
VFVTHGETAAAAAFAARIHDALGVAARVPELGETVAIQT